uniref:RNA-directed DNA polymerase, eukaryota n=1 Tax=Tanacetum cinerariifolium TaxID=118510 RepID=A0A6L2MC48_TANCI|nr:RNA-directed DNA polymerase, eukaryota [Tanacetum cinerariifolium]
MPCHWEEFAYLPGTWNININDNTSDRSSHSDVNHLDKEDISVEDKLDDDLDDLNGMLNDLGLIDLPIRGHYFTWMNKACTKLSKLNRFLISEGITEDIPDIKITAIDRMWSDHSPILLHVKKPNFGPSPFKFYNMWLNRDGFDDLIKSTAYIGIRNTAYLKDLLMEISQVDLSVDEDTCIWLMAYFLLSLDRLPHRLNLSSRGIDIPTISCSSCNGNVESADHIFFACDLVKEVWSLVSKWHDLSIPPFVSYDA